MSLYIYIYIYIYRHVSSNDGKSGGWLLPLDLKRRELGYLGILLRSISYYY